MRFILLLNLIFLFKFSFGQSPEQVALDFYAANVLNKPTDKYFLSYHKDIKLRYDKRINPINSKYQELAYFIISEYNACKMNSGGVNNLNVKSTYENLDKVSRQIETFQLVVPDSISQEFLIIPKGIKYKKKLKYKKRKGGFIRFYSQKLWKSFFKEKFNLTIEPHSIFKEHKYVWLKVDKNDLEYGDHYFIEIINDQVTDWCQESWIR